MFSYGKLAALIAVVLAALPAAAQTGQTVLLSPDGAIQMTIATVRGQAVQEAGGQLAYRVAFHGKPLLDWSNLGLAIAGSPVLGAAVRIESSQPSSQDETWKPVAGKTSLVRNHYNAVTVQTVEMAAGGRRLAIEARAYDDGVAFRYVVPEQPNVKEMRISNEATQFRFIRDATTWSLILRDFQTSSEDDYHELTLRGLHPEYLIGLPMLLEAPGVAWVGLTEADIDDWAGLFVHSVLDQTILTARLALRVEDPNGPHVPWPIAAAAESSTISVISQAPANSPWRMLMIASDPGRLVESNLVLNLNPPSAIADTSWIQPGKTSWNWWSDSLVKNVPFRAGMNTDTMKYYIDFSARMGFPYMLIDAGWAGRSGMGGRGANGSGTDLTKVNPNIDMPALLAYAQSKNVRLWLWSHWTDINRQMDEAFPLFEKWGIAGVKIDFMDRADQWMANWYRNVAKKAAEHHLMLDYHGAFKPDGLRRTYPNILTRESVMGAEYNKWSARETPVHNTTLPFTRMLAGPMDYTPGGFDNVTRENFEARNSGPSVMGTRVHQTALFVVFESELQMVADHPAAYDGQKETEFLKEVPATWDETRVIGGRPARFITIARRSGPDWYVGSITNWDPRNLDLPLTFLGPGSYTAEIYADGPNAAAEPKDSVLTKQRVDAKTVLKLKLAPGGGCAIHLTPVR
ncbi:MAG: glycoside hydrolase family 97 protein [Bryobacteraceae bacterium]|jgi:alpha-glucosidase